MIDFTKSEEIKKNIEHFIDDGKEIKASLTICVWNTSHLLKRSIEAFCKQDFPSQYWELIVIDDASLDDVEGAIEFAKGKINMRYVRLEHEYGMRGNCVSFNTGFAFSRGEVIMESTPEIIFTIDGVRVMYEPHLTEERAFVATKTYNLGQNDQLLIDTIDWREDVNVIKTLPEFYSDWTQNNFKNTNFGTHQSCSIKKSVFYEITKGYGFPLYGDYGSEDPMYCGLRQKVNIKGITIMEPMFFHQWHLGFNFFSSMGYAPMLNKFNHSTSNYLKDESGSVPEGGTCMIWDHGNTDPIGDDEKKAWKGMDDWFIRTGGLPSIIRPRVLSDGTIV